MTKTVNEIIKKFAYDFKYYCEMVERTIKIKNDEVEKHQWKKAQNSEILINIYRCKGEYIVDMVSFIENVSRGTAIGELIGYRDDQE